MNLVELTNTISGYVWGWPMIILLLGTHIFLTIRLKCPQRKIFTAIRLSVKKDKDSEGDVSQFAALATSLAATIGTGNIIGVATAVSLGGPGAVLWCWLTGIFGIATKYGEGLLAIKFREKTADGRMLGGPMYALEKGLKIKWLAILFAIFASVAAFGIGNTVQANAISENVSLLLHDVMLPNTARILVGVVIAALVAVVILGGVKSIAKICSALVPIMALFYVVGCIYILGVNFSYLGEALRLICVEAFSMKAAAGGTAGTVLMLAARYGIARGLFSNESGMGSAPIVAAAAQTRNPVRQALVSSSGTFWDTHLRTRHHHLHHRTPFYRLSRRWIAHKGSFRHHPLRGNSDSHFWHSYLLLFHHPRLELLWGTFHGIPSWGTLYHPLPHSMGATHFRGKRDGTGFGVEHCRHHECPHGYSEPHLSPTPLESDCQGHAALSVGRESR